MPGASGGPRAASSWIAAAPRLAPLNSTLFRCDEKRGESGAVTLPLEHYHTVSGDHRAEAC